MPNLFKLPPKLYHSVLLALILGIVFAAFSPSLNNGFVFWDDDVHLYENIAVQALDAEHIRDMFTGTVNALYIPLTTLSFALEHHFFGYDPFIYHLDNLLLHMGIVVLIFWLGLRLGLSTPASGLAALLFGVHPMHVESVAWVTERKDVLYAFLYLAAMLSYSRYLEFTKTTPSIRIKKSYRFLVLTVFFGLLSMLAKPMALSLPLILLLMDWFCGRRIGRDAYLEKIPLCIIIAGLTWISYSAHARVPGNSLGEGAMIWAWTFVFYVRQFLFPVVLVPVYQLPKPIAFNYFEYFMPIAILGILIIAVIRLRRHRWFIFAIAFYVCSIFFLLRYDEGKDINIVADRFMYLPSLGLCFWAGSGLMRCMNSFLQRSIAVILAILVTGTLSYHTYRYCHVWNNSITLWRHQLKYFPNEPAALNNLAAALREEGDYKDAEKQYKMALEMERQGMAVEYSDITKKNLQKVNNVVALYGKAIKVNPDFKDSYYNLGNLYADLGKIPEAVKIYHETLRLDPEYKDVHFSLAKLYEQAGDYKQAVFAYDQTIKLNADDEDVYVMVITAYNEALVKNQKNVLYINARAGAMDQFTRLVSSKSPRATSFFNLGYLYYGMGSLDRAISAYQRALDINPAHSKALYGLGDLYRDQGMLFEALSMYTKSVEANWRNSDAYVNIGAIYERQGLQSKAKEFFLKAIKADAKNARAYFNLGYIEESLGQLKQAMELYKKSIELDPHNPEAHYNLGNTYARLNMNNLALSCYRETVEADSGYLDAWINLSILSFKEGDFLNAVKYCDEAVLLGYNPPQGYLDALLPYRKMEQSLNE